MADAPHRSQKKWVPVPDAGTVRQRGQFWNPWPDRKQEDYYKHRPQGESKPYGIGATRRTDLDIPGKALAKSGKPIAE